MDNPSWDDGSLAPIFIRLAWHSSGTYDAATGTGGSNGAGMRFQNEAADPENAGLAPARAFLEPVKRKFPEISYSGEFMILIVICYKMKNNYYSADEVDVTNGNITINRPVDFGFIRWIGNDRRSSH